MSIYNKPYLGINNTDKPTHRIAILGTLGNVHLIFLCIFLFRQKHKIHRVYKTMATINFIGWALLVWEVYVYSNYNRNIYDGVNASFPSLGAMFLSLGFFMLIKDYKIYCSSLGTYFKFIGRNTMGVYVFHIFFVYSYRYFFSTECINPLCAILISFCIVNITAAISELMSKTKLIFFLK